MVRVDDVSSEEPGEWMTESEKVTRARADSESSESQLSSAIWVAALERPGLIRRVARAEFKRDRLINWKVSLDVDTKELPEYQDDGLHKLMPVAWFKKESFQNFSLRDASGSAVPLLSRGETAPLVARAAAKFLLRTIVSDHTWDSVVDEFWRHASSESDPCWEVSGRDTASDEHIRACAMLAIVAARPGQDRGGSIRREFDMAASAVEFLSSLSTTTTQVKEWLCFLSKSYLAVTIVRSRPRRQVLKYSYEWALNVDRAFGVRGQSQIRHGWRPEFLRLRIGGFHRSASAHIEVAAPKGTDILLGEWSDGAETGISKPNGDSVHMHLPVEPRLEHEADRDGLSHYRDVRARIGLQVRQRDQFNFGVIPAAVSAAVLLGLWGLARSGALDDNGNLIVALLFVVPALAYTQLLYGSADHYESVLLSGARRTTFAAASLMFLGVAGLAFDNDSGLRYRWWSRLALLAVLVAYVSVASWVASMARKRTFPTSDHGPIDFGISPSNSSQTNVTCREDEDGEARYTATLESTPPVIPAWLP